MKESIQTGFISSLEKCFEDEDFSSKPLIDRLSMLKNEHLSVQLMISDRDPGAPDRMPCRIMIKSPLAGRITVREVAQINVPMPARNLFSDEDYLRKEPGRFPDLLLPLRYDACLILHGNLLKCLWLDIRPDGGTEPGTYGITAEVWNEDQTQLLSSCGLTVEILPCSLPVTDFHYTQWFYADTLASYYNVGMFSERHWEIIENFLAKAADLGIDTILTPVLTPPLDTKKGGERPTCQLVDITVRNGEYTFGFSRFDRWVGLLLKYRFRQIEINHMFTQWGAGHAPKVMASVNGEKRRIFGWETDSLSEEYLGFVKKLLAALVSHTKELGVSGMLRFHISDEPSEKDLPRYLELRKALGSVTEGGPVMDAVSDPGFWKSGAVGIPVANISRVEDFIGVGVPHLWTYYCCSEGKEVSNRFVSMPSWRNRIIGVQMYKYGLEGFLHWGYDFYYNRFSDSPVDPYQDPCGDYFVPAGDAFSVYPKADGTPLDTVHALVFKHALEDMKAFCLCEQLCGRDFVISLIDGLAGMDVTFRHYPKDAGYILTLREKVNEAICQALTE